MSYELLSSKPINIPNKYSYSLPISDFNRYLFELKIKLKKKTKIIRKIEDSKNVQLINKDDKIKFDNLENFDINVHVLPDDNIRDLNMEGCIDINTNNYVRSTNKIYLEFLRKDSGYTECNCSVIFTDTYKYSISPPM
jgi:hypothetical protein